MKVKNVVIVVLNYIAYKETIECVDSACNLWYPITKIIIVDNNSQNKSLDVLRDYYKGNKKISIVRANKNYGFAKGNNIGISLARKHYGAEFVLTVNSDTVFVDPDYVGKLLTCYEAGVGIIGSVIREKSGRVSKFMTEYTDFISILGGYIEFFIEKESRIAKFIKKRPHKPKKDGTLNGCSLLFTPDYFKYYSGFFSKTFLYYEELLLKFQCDMKQLRMVCCTDTFIYHKRWVSSDLSFSNKEDCSRKYHLQSYKYVLVMKILSSMVRIVPPYFR